MQFGTASNSTGKTDAQKWLSRILASRKEIKDRLALRDHYEERLSFGYLEDAYPDEERTYSENYSYRYVRYLTSQISGSPMHVRMDRDAGEGQGQGPDGQPTPGDEKTADSVEEALRRDFHQAKLLTSAKAMVRHIAAYGCGGILLGYHAPTVTATVARDAAKDHSESQEEARTGTGEPSPHMDHFAEQQRLRMLLRDDPELTDEEADRIQKRINEHAELQRKSESKERTVSGIVSQRTYTEFMRPGEDYVWDWTGGPWEWVAIRIPTLLEDVKGNDEVYTKAFRSSVKGLGSRAYSMMDEDSSARNADSTGLDNKYVETWQIYVIKPQMRSGGIRLIVSPEHDQFCGTKKSKENPHVVDQITPDGMVGPDHGKPIIPGFFPVFHCAPLDTGGKKPEDRLGLPLIAPARAQQDAVDRMSAMRVSSALRAKRLYGISSHLMNSGVGKKIGSFLTGPGDSHYFAQPPALSEDESKAKSAVTAYDLGGIRAELENQYQSAKTALREILGMPASVMAVSGAAPTATQDKMGVAHGDAEAGLIIDEVEETIVEVAYAELGMMREYYGTETINSLLGSKGATDWAEWSKSSMDGDLIEIGLGSKQRVKEAVQVEQIMKALGLAQEYVDPALGIQPIDLRPIYSVLFKALKMGEPQWKGDHTVMLEMTVQSLSKQIEEMGTEMERLQNQVTGQAGSGGGAPGTPGPDPSTDLGAQAPQDGTLMAGAARDTVGAGANGSL